MSESPGFTARVAEVRDESEGVRSFLLEPLGRAGAVKWEPGAHFDLALAPGLNRQYSLCGDASDPASLRFAVLREPQSQGGSSLLHDTIRRGDTLQVTAVRNNFPLVEAQSYLLVAGGIGITPLLAMARKLEQSGRDWRLLYGGRTRASMAFTDELAGYGAKVEICPEDECGLLDLASFLGSPEDGKVVYCCGPEPLTKAVESHCAAWPEDALQIERFHPKEQEPHEADIAFEVELQQSGKVLTIPADQSIAETLEEAGVYIPRSCNEGTCGTCLTSVVEGVPDHRDSFLRPRQREKNRLIMVCCSRSKTPRLVLDV